MIRMPPPTAEGTAPAEGLRELMTTREVSGDTGIPEGTLRYWRKLGIGPVSFSLGPKRVVYRRSEVTRWIEQQEEATARGGSPPPNEDSNGTLNNRQEVQGAVASTTPTPTKEEAERVSA